VDLDIHKVAKGRDDLDDLLGELAGGSQHHGLALANLNVDALQNSNGESGGLASTCWGGVKRGLVCGFGLALCFKQKKGGRVAKWRVHPVILSEVVFVSPKVRLERWLTCVNHPGHMNE
jgi:hypothetical protein